MLLKLLIQRLTSVQNSGKHSLLHRILLYEHYDFLMATQHPSATPALSGLAQKYSMPTRMWRHGIHAFLEVLRHRRPGSQHYMLAFIYLAYQMMALLFIIVPTFTDTWIECLGDLARYRMAIEEDKEIHSIWGGVAARWYSLASNRHPQIGRLYHRLGVLERPSLRKMSLYAKSLTTVEPFPNTRESLGTLCSCIIQDQQSIPNGIDPLESKALTYFAYVVEEDDENECSELASEILNHLEHQPSSVIERSGVSLLITIIAALLQFGSPSNGLLSSFSQLITARIHASRPSTADFPPTSRFDIASTSAHESVYEFCYLSFQAIMRRGKDPRSFRQILPLVHVMLVWQRGVHELESLDSTVSVLSSNFPWIDLCDFLNTLIEYYPISPEMFDSAKARTSAAIRTE